MIHFGLPMTISSLLPQDITIGPNSNGLPGIGQLRSIIDAPTMLRSWPMPGRPLEFGPIVMSCGSSDEIVMGRPEMDHDSS